MANNVNPQNLTTMCMLDPVALEKENAGTALFSGPDLYTSLQRQNREAEREKWLMEKLKDLRDDTRRYETNRLLNEELKAVGDVSLIGAQDIKLIDKVHPFSPDMFDTVPS